MAAVLQNNMFIKIKPEKIADVAQTIISKVFSWNKKLFKSHFDSKLTEVHSQRSILRYRQVSNIKRTLVGNKIVDNSDVVGASPVGAAPTTSSLST